MKIGIFGGSFDPIHLGHTRIINEAIISLQLDKMLIVPNTILGKKTVLQIINNV